MKSKWNNKVEGINAEVYIDNSLVGKSLDYNLDKWGKKNIPVYINIKNVEIGEHNIEIVLKDRINNRSYYW